MPATCDDILDRALEYQNQLDRLVPGYLERSAREYLRNQLAFIRSLAATQNLKSATLAAQALTTDYPFLDGMRFLRNLLLALSQEGGVDGSSVAQRPGEYPGLYDLGSETYFVRSDRFELQQANITLVSNMARIYAHQIVERAGAGERRIGSIGVEGAGPAAAFIYNALRAELPGCNIKWARSPLPMLGFGFPTTLTFYPFQDMAPFLGDDLRRQLNKLNPFGLESGCFDGFLRNRAGFDIPDCGKFPLFDPRHDLYVITYGISPGYAPLVGEMHDLEAAKRVSPKIHTPWMRPKQNLFEDAIGSTPPLCLVSGASGGAATALMTLFAHRIPEGQLDTAHLGLLQDVQDQFSEFYGQLKTLVSECANRLIVDEPPGRQYHPRMMNDGAWSAVQHFCEHQANHEQLLRLLERHGFSADISLVLHAGLLGSDGCNLMDPFRGTAGPLLSLINYPLLKKLLDNGRLVSLDSRATSVRWVESNTPSDETPCRIIVSKRNANFANQSRANGAPEVRDRWRDDDEILAIAESSGELVAKWEAPADVVLPVFAYICLSHGPRPDANLSAFATASGRVDVVGFLTAIVDG